MSSDHLRRLNFCFSPKKCAVIAVKKNDNELARGIARLTSMLSEDETRKLQREKNESAM